MKQVFMLSPHLQSPSPALAGLLDDAIINVYRFFNGSTRAGQRFAEDKSLLNLRTALSVWLVH
jgi:hypothetical protein